MRPLIFLVEGDPQSCRVMRACLERAHYRIREYFSHDILLEVEALRPSAVVIDVESQNGAARELCRAIRSSAVACDTRLILVTRRGVATDSAMGFDTEADDCLTRPILPGELLARIEAVLRHRPAQRFTSEPATDSELKLGDLQLDLLALRVSVNGRIVPTTVLEFRLLEYMARNQGRVFTRDQLLDAVWGAECFVTPRTVDACVRRIRTKIGAGHGQPSLLKTIRGVGYSLDNGSSFLALPRSA